MPDVFGLRFRVELEQLVSDGTLVPVVVQLAVLCCFWGWSGIRCWPIGLVYGQKLNFQWIDGSKHH